MYGWSKLNKNESGQAALEAAIILIAFVVVASVFAFAILSAGSASTEKGEQAIYAGLQGVQSSMQIKGAVTAAGAGGFLTHVYFTVALVAGGDPIDLADNSTVISFHDATQSLNIAATETALTWPVVKVANTLLEDGELAQIDVTITAQAVAANSAFTLEIKPPTGAILQINRTTPAAITAVMELR